MQSTVSGLNIIGCLLTKRLTKGRSHAPQDPPWLRPCTVSFLEEMLVHCRVTPSVEFFGTHLIHLGGERHWSRTQLNVPNQGFNQTLSIKSQKTLTMRLLPVPYLVVQCQIHTCRLAYESTFNKLDPCLSMQAKVRKLANRLSEWQSLKNF